MSQKYSVMSYNIRINVDRDGKYQLFPHRFPYAVEYLKSNGTDIICFQEVQPNTREGLLEAIGDKYEFVGHGRGADFREEACCIAFRRDKFDLLACDTFWLSPTPGKPNSTPVGERMPRICTTATLLPKTEGQDVTPFRIYNTHMFHTPDERLRTYGIYVILERIRRDAEYANYPIILTGDFNSAPDSLAIEAVHSYPSVTLTDATETLGYTYHEYEREGLSPDKKVRIDYIFTNARFDPASAERITSRRESDGMFLSDHYPIKVEIEI